MNYRISVQLTRYSFFLLVFGFISQAFRSSSSKKRLIKLNEGEKIWSGVVKEGHLMPFADNHQFDFFANNLSNQLLPLDRLPYFKIH